MHTRRSLRCVLGPSPGLVILIPVVAFAGACSSPDATTTSATQGPDGSAIDAAFPRDATVRNDGDGEGGGSEAWTPVDAGTPVDESDAMDGTGSKEAGAPDVAPSKDATPEAAPPSDAVDQASGPQVCGLASCAPGAPCADLVVDVDDLRASTVVSERTFAANDCAILEGCIAQPGTRKLLRFDTATANVGSADVLIGDPIAGPATACFVYSQCHMHYHFRGVGSYTLYQPDGKTIAAAGHKQGFCLDDTRQYPPAPGPMPATPYICTNQGLHVGWEDIYPNDIDCQWIDITGVPPGPYVLSVVINPQHLLPESNYDNDEARVPVTIP